MDKKQALNAISLTADILELLGNDEFKVLAYRKAERMLERFEGSWDEALQTNFKKVPGIGAQLGSSLVAFADSGVFEPLSDVASLVPPGVLELFRVRGLGPKKVRVLWDAGVDGIAGLLEFARAGKLAVLKGFGAASSAKIMEAAEFTLKASERRLMAEARAVFGMLGLQLQGVASQLEVAGSLRRGLETCGDVDAMALGDRDQIMVALEPFEAKNDPEYPWLIKSCVEGVDVQLAVSSQETWGATQLMMTGSKPFLDGVKARAIEKNIEFSSRGMFQNGLAIPTPTERDAFEVLDLEYRIPEWREAEHLGLTDLPDPEHLVKLDQMRGMLHVHSNWSDGAASLRDMALGARARGAKYLGICDHSKTAIYANGLDETRVRAQWREIDSLNAELEDFRILKGIESDILADGRLDYDDELLAGFDFVVASVHSSFGLPEIQQTERLVRAVSNKFTTILGHPTGRLLLRRPPYKFDHAAVLEAAAASDTVIEINASPYRLDLDWREVLNARGTSLTFAINTDAHRVEGFDDLWYGVQVARKAALVTHRVINTLEMEDFLKLVATKRGRV
jgi:DNA polymerase (family X)